MRVFEDCDLAALARADDLPLIATSPHVDTSIHEADLGRDVAWIFGHEGRGVDPALLAGASTVTIPQSRAVESLNVGAAAAICFFEQRRQRAARTA
jgi:TrmH family RNA methyltransferase